MNPGAVYEGRQEKDDALNLTLAVGQILQNHGFDVEYTRTTDVYESPFEKAMEANNAGVDFFVSIHRNSYPVDNAVSGVESLVYDLSGIKYEMAQNINKQLETVGFVNLGVHARPNLIVLRLTRMPAVLVEAGFINSDTDNLLFDQNFDDIAQAIADGIMETLNVPASANVDMESETGDEMRDEMQDENVYRVQVGAFRNVMYARRLLRELEEQEFPAFIEQGDGYYRVQVGNFKRMDDAADMERRLKWAGYPTVIVR